MSRLPTPGSDDGTWGTVLNDYLSVSLASDGTVKALTVGTSQLVDGSVSSPKLATGAVTTTTILDTTITIAKLAASVQTSLGKADTALQSAPVTSVATKTGAVTLTGADVGLGNVNNTSDLNEPISTATQTALNTASSTAPSAAFSILTSNPRFIASPLGLIQGAIIRAIIKSPETGDIFVSQSTVGSNGTTSPYETLVISRLGRDGALLDTMTCTDGGRGLDLALEYSGSTMYIWCAYQKPLGAGNTWDLVRFPYVGGSTILRTDASLVTMNKFTTDYTTVALDMTNDYVAFWRNGTSHIYELRKISEVKAGTNTVYYSKTLTENPPTYRGHATIDGNLYISYGALNETSGDTDLIKVYKWSDGSVVATVATGSLGKLPSGSYPGNTHEQGGCSLYRDPTTGSASLLLGVTLNTSTNYNWKLFGFPTQATDTLKATAIEASINVLPYLTSNEARRMNGATTTLSSVTTPGWWYFTPTEVAALTDAPFGITTTDGYFLQVSGKDSSSSVIQTLYHNSATSLDQYVRTVGTSGAISVWTQSIHGVIAGLTGGADMTDQGYLGWSYPPEYITGANKIQYSGGLNAVKIRIPTDCTITYLHVGLDSAINKGTTGANGLALYDNAGNLLSSCGDMTTTWGTAGAKKVPLTTPVAVKAGYYAIAFWSTIGGGGTSPHFFYGENLPNLGLYNDNLAQGSYRYFLGATSGVTTAPATIGPESLCGSAWWVACS